MRFLFLVVFGIHVVKCARILGMFFFPGYSHFVLGETLFKELAAKGHDVTVISAFPQKQKLKNYRDVTTTELNEWMQNMRGDDNLLRFLDKSSISIIMEVFGIGTMVSDMCLQGKEVQNLLQSNETFDVIILEQFLNEAHFGFMHHFKAPLILMGTTVSSLWTNTLMGNPTPYAYVPNLFANLSPEMNFWERTWNTFLSVFHDLYFHLLVLPKHDEILHKYFTDAPPLKDLMYNASLIFLNSHPTIGTAVPLLPNMIEIGGFHIQNHKPLSGELKKFLDEAKEGVVYFSMGSNMQSKYLPLEKRQALLKAFSRLKLKVLWKWEDDNLPGKPDNVRIEKWLPQPAVLAHKNVKLFVTHSGRLSTTEAVYFGKPIIGIPLFAEQYANIQEAAYLGYGLFLPFQDLTEDRLTEALTEMIENPRYAEMAKYRSAALHDLEVPQLDKAVHWVEYVIKHKGVPHLRNAGLRLSWYQYLLLDVIVFFFVALWIFKKILYALFCRLRKGSKSKKEKIKKN